MTACRDVPEVQPGLRCPTGECRVTAGFNLPARYVIHTVGPVWRGGNAGEPELLASCYRNCLRKAIELKLASIAFPAISCGVYGYPISDAARIAVSTVMSTCDERKANLEQPQEHELYVSLVAFDARDFEVIRGAVSTGMREAGM